VDKKYFEDGETWIEGNNELTYKNGKIYYTGRGIYPLKS